MATLVRFEPFRELAAMHNEMSRFMNNLFEGNGQVSQSWVPALDVWEAENEVVYAIDLPGIPEDQISIELDDGAITVTAQREQSSEVKKEGYQRYERRYGQFVRTFGVPQGVTDEDIKAEFTDGVLTLHVALPEQPKPRRIAIGGSHPSVIEGEVKQES